MRLVAITNARKPSIAINASQRAIRARITSRMARPPEPRRPPADELFNSVHFQSACQSKAKPLSGEWREE